MHSAALGVKVVTRQGLEMCILLRKCHRQNTRHNLFVVCIAGTLVLPLGRVLRQCCCCFYRSLVLHDHRAAVLSVLVFVIPHS